MLPSRRHVPHPDPLRTAGLPLCRTVGADRAAVVTAGFRGLDPLAERLEGAGRGWTTRARGAWRRLLRHEPRGDLGFRTIWTHGRAPIGGDARVRPLPRVGATRPRGRALGAAAGPLVAAFLLSTPTPVCGAEDVPVTWVVYDAAPFMIGSGADRDTGIFDRIRHLLDDRLAGGPQATLGAPFPRFLASLKDGAPLCSVAGVKTPERDRFVVFSLPVAMFYPLRVVYRETQRARFASPAPLSVKDLLQDRRLETSMLKDRSLGAEMDALLRRDPPSHVYSDFGEAFRMLFADRLDYLVEYSAIAAYEAHSLGHDGGLLEHPLAEAPAPVFSRVMCPKTDWGRRLIARIDAILRVERQTAAYRRIVEAWTERADLATIREVYDSAFLTSE